jgi:hypothetical protein
VSVSIVAYLALILFVPFSATVFAFARPAVATAVVLVSAVLFLPERVAYDPPGLPPLDKHTVAGLCAFLGCLATNGRRLFRAKPGRGVDLFGLVLVAGAFGTALTNKDALLYGPTYIQGLTIHDGISDAIQLLLYAVMPFLLGRAFYRSADDVRDLMVVVVMAAIVYSPLVLFELRVSPQLHRWVYGFHQHEFQQTIREGGYRPMVFMAHGLALALFLCIATMFATALARAGERLPFGMPPASAAIYLGVLLVLVKSAGALVYAVVGVPLLLLSSPKTQTRIAAVLGAFVAAYPFLRVTNQFPTEGLVNIARDFSQDRAASLEFRFDNEKLLIHKALERLTFGWGGFGRHLVYADWGKSITVTDGHWIIMLGSFGVVGTVGSFGMLVMPILLARRRLRRVASPRDRVVLGAITLVVAFACIDLLPNGMFNPLPLFFAGVAAGVSAGLVQVPARRVRAAVAPAYGPNLYERAR